MIHNINKIRHMSCYDRALYVRKYNNWAPIKINVTTTNDKPAILMADCNGTLSLWSLTDDYSGSLNLNLLK